jgi:hypothetical protein
MYVLLNIQRSNEFIRESYHPIITLNRSLSELIIIYIHRDL